MIIQNIIYISWKKDDVEKKSKIKINFETNEEKRLKALEKINYINEQRYVDFLNPKTSKNKPDNEFLVGLSNLKNDVSKYK